MDDIRRCIRCSDFKSVLEFNTEHIFPAAIGGVFTTDRVCRACNTLLNQNVDEAFVKSNFVLYYRHNYNLNRDQNRSIPNLTKKTVKNAEGNDTLLKFKDGELRSEVLDKFNYEINENGEILCTLTIDGSKVDKMDEIIRNNLQRLGKKLGVDKGTDYTIVSTNKNETKPFHFNDNIPNALLVKECVKIAYEAASIITEGYILEDTAKMFSDFLVSDSISDDVREHLDLVGVNKHTHYQQRFNALNLQLHQHAILFDNIEGEGVYAVVKIFQFIYPILLTKNTKLFPQEEFLLVNDVLSRSLSSNQLLNYKFSNCSVNLSGLSDDIQEKIKAIGLTYFEIINNTWVFYNDKGKVKYDSIDALCANISSSDNISEDRETNLLTLDLGEKNIFIKTTDNLLIQILSLVVKPLIVTQKLPPNN